MSYSIPRRTTQLGTVLDLLVECDDGDTRVTIEEWKGWLLLTDADAMRRARPKLYLVRSDEVDEPPPRSGYGDATKTYERWHKRRANEVREYDVPDVIGRELGRVLRIGYRSDKWNKRRRMTDYDHDFTEDGGSPPLLYSSGPIGRARAAVVVGGDMQITPEGIA